MYAGAAEIPTGICSVTIVASGGGGGSSFVTASTTDVQGLANNDASGRVTISYDPSTDACPAPVAIVTEVRGHRLTPPPVVASVGSGPCPTPSVRRNRSWAPDRQTAPTWPGGRGEGGRAVQGGAAS